MFRNQYDTDATTFSPAGRLFQVEYAQEAVKQGSGCIGVTSKTHAVVVALKRQASRLASYQQKVFQIDSHMGIAISGLTSDARVLAKYMQNECLNHKYVFDSPMQLGRLVTQVSDKSQVYTQKSEKRPYGVGLLVAGYDKTGPHLFQTLPSGNFFEYKAQAMGARSQGAKTYLEKFFETFEDLSLDDLIRQALTALKSTSDKPLTSKNVTVGFVGKDTPFTIYDDDAVARYVALVADDEEEDERKRKTAEESKTPTPAAATVGAGAAVGAGATAGAGAGAPAAEDGTEDVDRSEDM